jgi:hypothetical protein
VVPAWSSAHRFSCSAAILAAVRQKLHLSNLFKNPEPALLTPGSELARVRLAAASDTELTILSLGGLALIIAAPLWQ